MECEEKKEVGMWQMVSEIYWYKINNKNKWHIYLSISGIKLVCTLSFNLRVIVERI